MANKTTTQKHKIPFTKAIRDTGDYGLLKLQETMHNLNVFCDDRETKNSSSYFTFKKGLQVLKFVSQTNFSLKYRKNGPCLNIHNKSEMLHSHFLTTK